MSELIYHLRPELDRPYLILTFTGWPNAGEVSTDTYDYLAGRLNPQPLASLALEGFVDLTENRPMALIEDGQVLELSRPKSVFAFYHGGLGPDLILFKGQEPNYRWDDFCDLILQVVRDCHVRAVFTLGGTYDYVPHWLPARVSNVWSNQAAQGLVADLKNVLALGRYHGPVSIHSYFLVRAREHDLPVIGLWGHAPVYIQTGNVKVQYALIDILKKTIGLSLDISDLLSTASQMDQQIEEMAQNNQGLRKHLDDLRKHYEGTQDSDGSKPSGSSAGRGGKIIPFPWDKFFRRD